MIYKSDITTAIILDTRRKKKDKTYPVKLRITHKRKQKLYKINESLTVSDFEKIVSTNPRGELKIKKILFSKIEEKAIELINELPVFSFKIFEDAFFNNKYESNNVANSYERYITQLKDLGQIGTSETYKYSLNSIIEFSGNRELIFEEITPEFLSKYEKYQLSKNKSYTTISIYLRCLKKIFNDAITDKKVKPEYYPFGKSKYQAPATNNVKKALALSEIEKIFYYHPVNQSEEYARDIWVFSYLCNGMNIKDISYLKYNNIDGNKIHYIREKTKHSTRNNLTQITVILTEEVGTIIEKWGNKPIRAEAYIFPIITNEMTVEEKRKRIRQTTKTVNKYIDRICQQLGIEKHVTTYSARHSYSTVLKRSGASIEYISESLGHKNIKTTQNYLDSFEDDIRFENAKLLTSFKNHNSDK